MKINTLGFEFMAALVLLAGQSALANTVRVVISDSKFTPAIAEIYVGDTVEFVSEAGYPHTVTADKTLAANPDDVILPEGAEPFNSGILTKGQKFSHTFTVAGDYQYVCLKHEVMMGMKGQIKVEEDEDPISQD